MMAKVFNVTKKPKLTFMPNDGNPISSTFRNKSIYCENKKNPLLALVVVFLILTFYFTEAKSNNSSEEISQIKGSVNSTRGKVQSIKILNESGGRVSWSPTGDKILFDKKNTNGFYDIFIVNSDGSEEKCLTCNGQNLSNGHHGQPEWHPSGNFVVFQSQKKGTESHWGKSKAAEPGFGRHSDLWLMDVNSSQFYSLTNTPNDNNTGVLHPHFSNDGLLLSWGEMYKEPNFFIKAGGAGFWKLKVANFSIENKQPLLTNIQSYDPGSNPGWHENHGFSADNSTLLFTSNYENTKFLTSNIYQYDRSQSKLIKMTHQDYNEHALFTRDNKRIIWMSNTGNLNKGTDYWSMNLDGSDKVRITDFNNPDLSSFKHKSIVAADSSLSPDGSKMVAYLQTNILTQNGMTVLIELKSDEIINDTSHSDTKAPNGQFIHQQGNKIKDGKGNEIFLKGSIVLGSFQWEGTLWNTGLNSETQISNKIKTLVGDQEFENFKTKVYQNFFNENDIIAMKKLGFNVVRLPFNHLLLEDDDKPYEYKQSGWDTLDKIIKDCKKHDLNVVLDLHSAAGGQTGLFIADPDWVKLWDNKENKKRTVALWKAIAERYKDEEIIAGYDLLNEPDVFWSRDLVLLYKDIIAAIRQVDNNHMVIVEGNKLATDFSIFKEILDDNMMYSFHTYSLFGPDQSEKHLEHVKKIAATQNIPIWNGEFGANNIEWTAKTVKLLNNPESNNSGWIFWNWKKLPEESIKHNYRHLYAIQPSSGNWEKVRKYIGFFGKKPSKQEAISGLNEFIEMIKLENCKVDLEMQEILK